jgi:hypothetical protein
MNRKMNIKNINVNSDFSEGTQGFEGFEDLKICRIAIGIEGLRD